MKYLLNQLRGYYPSAYEALAERKGAKGQGILCH